MADETNDSKTISKTSSGFPDYLDFEKLRAEGIEHLGNLAGKIWTDHNVHDPGITILEMLCYALLDLGYRTNLPVADIFARPPGDTTKDNNFFTPAQILTNNPLTITDYRKLLMDVKGVKNAWLEVADDVTDFCRPKQPPPPPPDDVILLASRQSKCKDFLNGLYHVYLELEALPQGKTEEEFEKKTQEEVRTVLMAHRNLCEDFVDISILCKFPIGVCADLELEKEADAEKVYLAVVKKLTGFFSPSLRFYTLQQLLDKGKPIEEIFAGRPHNLTKSHGFIDTEELEQYRLRKEIHLSDVYNILLQVEGVRAVRNLKLRRCTGNNPVDITGWVVPLPRNHVPEFYLPCSVFQFTRNTMPVFLDFKKFEGMLQLGFSNNGKVLYTAPSPYLDAEIPKGVYRADLGDYFSIQNEFPRVYGIGEGGLPDSASSLRKAQALQLKSYLLFFDQLLANYLMQLKNIRSLFSLSAPLEEEAHTYFISQLTTVPGLQQLVRFNTAESVTSNFGTQGSILAIPVNRQDLEDLKTSNQLTNAKLEDFRPYIFASLAEQRTAISQLRNDLFFEAYTFELVTKNDECVYFYLTTCSQDIALLGKKYFRNEQEARENAETVKYIGVFEENYRSYTTTSGASFDIELSLVSFSKYLQLIAEDGNLFIRRRQGFLNHLLARFAETFTDFALLSFGFHNSQELEKEDIPQKEKFLTHYDEISSNRGKAHDYLANKWNNNNVSGFERKFKALSGTENWKRHSLCNFEVFQYELQYEIKLRIADKEYFRSEEKFDSREEAAQAAFDLFHALQQEENYQTGDQAGQLKVQYGDNHSAILVARYTVPEDRQAARNLSQFLSGRDWQAKPVVSVNIYQLQLQDINGHAVRKSVKTYKNTVAAREDAGKHLKKINDQKKWTFEEYDPSFGVLHPDPANSEVFIHTDAFKIDVDNTILGNPEKFTYELLDQQHRFKIISVIEFDDAAQAQAHARDLLHLLAKEESYLLILKDNNKYALQIIHNSEVQAISTAEYGIEEEARQMQQIIQGIVRQHLYTLTVAAIPYRWKFGYQLGYEPSHTYTFQSVEDYVDEQEAAAAASTFAQHIEALELHQYRDAWQLVVPGQPARTGAVKLQGALPQDQDRAEEDINRLLEERKEISRLQQLQSPDDFERFVQLDVLSQEGTYVYRLVDKDKVLAFYLRPFATKDDAESERKIVSKQYKPHYLELMPGGDITREVKDNKNNTWYRYQLRSLREFYQPGGEELILFESVKGYKTKEEAEKAFQENYLSIINNASDAANYGRSISTTPVQLQTDDTCREGESIVFIPERTIMHFGYEGNAVTEIVKRAKSFPIRQVLLFSDEFKELFPCEVVEEETKKSCKEENEKIVYYFRLSSADTAIAEWQSVNYYYKPEEAVKDFYFFLLLLRYAGNYYVDCDDCTKEGTVYRIYLREVLAESRERFGSEAAAWGKEGVQRFICVAQTPEGFQAFLNKENCCYSFYVACKNGFVDHPCAYDTPDQRDRAMEELHRRFLETKNSKWYGTDIEITPQGTNTLVLSNERGERFASVLLRDENRDCYSYSIFIITTHAAMDDRYEEREGLVYLKNEQGEDIAVSYQRDYSMQQWKEMLQDFICHYPVIKKEEDNDRRSKYCIEIKLPGFSTCKADADEQPCGCAEKQEEPVFCYVAWKSRCCYDSCREAEEALKSIYSLLSNRNYYKAVFDCDCGPYGIALQFNIHEVLEDDNISYYTEEALVSNWHNGEEVAFNPQCYPTPQMACEAIERAKKLINSEGLHLTEHILLRPHCDPDDCYQCDEYRKSCINKTECSFEWPLPDEDPCIEEEAICFEPGADRYSFIATVVLPAWPARFRKNENRVLLEHMLYREAPAHVLLRILWLAPHDFCCFEEKYKNWTRWLAQRTNCTGNFSVCDFMRFLFERNFECLDDCDDCICEEEQQPVISCFDDDYNKEKECNFLDQVNDLYCWRKTVCGTYEFTDCETAPVQWDEPDRGMVSIASAISEQPFFDAGTTSDEDREAVYFEELPAPPAQPVQPIQEMPVKQEPPLMKSRWEKFHASAEQVQERAKQNPLPGKVKNFLENPEPTTDKLTRLLTELINNKEPKEGKPLFKTQVQELLQVSISHYLDTIFFSGRSINVDKVLHRMIEKLKDAKINIRFIYNYWYEPGLKDYETEVKEEDIRQHFT